jgi:hypothetical protein
MNPWHEELKAQYIQAEIRREIAHNHLVARVKMNHPVRPGLLGRRLLALGNWMVRVGEELRCRYESPSSPCTQTPSGNFAN